MFYLLDYFQAPLKEHPNGLSPYALSLLLDHPPSKAWAVSFDQVQIKRNLKTHFRIGQGPTACAPQKTSGSPAWLQEAYPLGEQVSYGEEGQQCN